MAHAKLPDVNMFLHACDPRPRRRVLYLLDMRDTLQGAGRNLRAYRQARGLSQEAFADVLGIHLTYMGAIERGERNLTLKSVERIVDCLDLDPLVLLTESVETADRKPSTSPAGSGAKLSRTDHTLHCRYTRPEDLWIHYDRDAIVRCLGLGRASC